jgi:hypothetical protein
MTATSDFTVYSDCFGGYSGASGPEFVSQVVSRRHRRCDLRIDPIGLHGTARPAPRTVSGIADVRIRRMANPAGRRQTGVVPAHYRAPGWFTPNVVNQAVAFSTRHEGSIGLASPCGEGICQRRVRTTRSMRLTTTDAVTSSRCAVTVTGSASAGRGHRRTAGRQARRSLPKS